MSRLRVVGRWIWVIANSLLFAAWVFVILSDVHPEIGHWLGFGVHGAMMALSFPLGVAWYWVVGWGVMDLLELVVLPVWLEILFACGFTLGISVCGYIQWFRIAPWLLRRRSLTPRPA